VRPVVLSLPPTVIGPLLQGASTVRVEGLMPFVTPALAFPVGIVVPQTMLLEVGIGPQVAAARRVQVPITASTMDVDLGFSLGAGQYVRAGYTNLR
jgi:hypothetical protein